MKFKIGAIAAVLALVAACQEQATPVEASAPRITSNMVPKILCSKAVGSGIRTANRQVITADHVIRDGGCSVMVEGQPRPSLRVTKSDAELDFAELNTIDRLNNRTLQMDCGGIQTGETYWLAGYPSGGSLEINEAQATAEYVHGKTSTVTVKALRVMNGRARQGMSGGPVITREGKVVAIINATDANNRTVSFVRELKHTWMCNTPEE